MEGVVVYWGNIGEYNKVYDYDRFGLVETRKGIRRPRYKRGM